MGGVVANPFTPIPKSAKSHVRGWAEHWAQLLATEGWHDSDGVVYDGPFEVIGKEGDYAADSLFLEHGVNFTPGTLNLFGGLSGEMAERFMDFLLGTGDVVFLDHTPEACGYTGNMLKRLGQKSCDPFFNKTTIGQIEERFADAPTLTQMDMFDGYLVVGDSHATAYAEKPGSIERINGLTLFGALRDLTFEKTVERYLERFGEDFKKVTLVAGSIDVRHHLMRQDNPVEAAASLMTDFIEAGEAIQDEYGVECEIAFPVPIEFEGRRIPKTGFYQGEPFAGTLEDRQDLLDVMNETIVDLEPELDVVMPPEDWYTMDPERYAKTHMEAQGSVHISPEHYRRKGGWETL